MTLDLIQCRLLLRESNSAFCGAKGDTESTKAAKRGTGGLTPLRSPDSFLAARSVFLAAYRVTFSNTTPASQLSTPHKKDPL